MRAARRAAGNVCAGVSHLLKHSLSVLALINPAGTIILLSALRAAHAERGR